MTAGTLAVLLATLLVLAMIVGPLLISVAHRLDRLHLRTEAAWAALDAALGRRAAVARTVAVTGAEPVDVLAAAADRAEHAPRTERETAENQLTRLLAEVDRTRLPTGLAAELADAEHRVVLARRVHNDAVRDTVALRRWRSVRWLRLAGTAAQPVYFEILEPEPATGPTPPKRASARVLLADGADRVLLFCGADPGRPAQRCWFPPEGGPAPGEELRAAAVRELAEETGIKAGPDALTGPIWLRHAVFEFDHATYHRDEWFFLLHTERTEIDTIGCARVGLEPVDAHRWWSVAELRSTSDTIYPVQLAEMLRELFANGWDGQTRSVW